MNASVFDGSVSLVAIALAAVVLRFHLWRALSFFAPGWLRIEPDAPSDQMEPPAALKALESELAGLGYQPLGRHTERRTIGPTTLVYDYVAAPAHTFAMVHLPEGSPPRVTLLTPTDRGGVVLTSNHPRPARSVPGCYESGGMEGAAFVRVHRAHVRRLERFSTAAPFAATLDACVEAVAHWNVKWAAPEVRQQSLFALLWSLGSLGMVTVVLYDRFGRGFGFGS